MPSINTSSLTPQAVRHLRWAHGRLEVQALGGMLAPVVFRANGHADFAPLQVAPWADEPGAEQWDGLLRRLRGEWPCVPFGRCDTPAGLPPGWTAQPPGDAWSHGFASHHAWQWLDLEEPGAEPDALALRIDYPAESAIAHLVRRIQPDPAQAAVHIALEVHARRAVTLPVALHPTFSLGLGRVRLHVPAFASGHSYPVPCEPGVSRLRPSAAFEHLQAVPTDGASLDLTQFPLPHDTEELLQLRGVPGTVHLDYLDAGWRATLQWPAQDLPDLMLWVSHQGRRQPPWRGRHLALGVEPVNGCFDLGRVTRPPAGHALADRVGLALDPDAPRLLRYSLSAQPLAGMGH